MNFIPLLRTTKKYKDLFCTIEGRIAWAISLILSYCFVVPFVLQTDCEVVKTSLFNLSCSFISTSVISLMLLVIAFSSVCKMIKIKTIQTIQEEKKEKSFITVLFTFYYLGFLIVIDVLMFVLMLFCSLFGIPHITILIFCYSTILLFLNFFIIFYTFNLIHLIINLFFLNYKINKE